MLKEGILSSGAHMGPQRVHIGTLLPNRELGTLSKSTESALRTSHPNLLRNKRQSSLLPDVDPLSRWSNCLTSSIDGVFV